MLANASMEGLGRQRQKLVNLNAAPSARFEPGQNSSSQIRSFDVDGLVHDRDNLLPIEDGLFERLPSTATPQDAAHHVPTVDEEQQVLRAVCLFQESGEHLNEHPHFSQVGQGLSQVVTELPGILPPTEVHYQDDVGNRLQERWAFDPGNNAAWVLGECRIP